MFHDLSEFCCLSSHFFIGSELAFSIHVQLLSCRISPAMQSMSARSNFDLFITDLIQRTVIEQCSKQLRCIRCNTRCSLYA